MASDTWTAVDAYVEAHLLDEDPVLDAALRDMAKAGLPAIQVSPLQGRFLHLLAMASGAERILEVGTLGGYSTIWLARALPEGGHLTSLEVDAKHAAVARANLERAGVADRVTIRVGAAMETLPKLEAEGVGPFDLAFLDADKEHNADYLTWAVRLGHPGTLIVVDNVVRGGGVVEAEDDDPRIQGTRRLFDTLAKEPRVVATALQTVGTKGYDGFVLARVVNAD